MEDTLDLLLATHFPESEKILADKYRDISSTLFSKNIQSDYLPAVGQQKVNSPQLLKFLLKAKIDEMNEREDNIFSQIPWTGFKDADSGTRKNPKKWINEKKYLLGFGHPLVSW